MHGLNVLRGYDSKSDGNKIQVHKIFRTIQGEGPFSGMPAIFVRLSGCNLRCTFCDTVWDDENDLYLDAELLARLIKESMKKPDELVVLTGGEPCRQPLHLLLAHLGDVPVQIETAGTYWQECLSYANVTLVCSPKTMHVHPKIKDYCDHWKYVILAGGTSEADGLPNISTQPESETRNMGTPCRPPERDGVTIWLSPCDEENEADNRENRMEVGRLALQHNYRAGLQVHKYLELE
jgi:7-carboxy-7-deazaguanine synthase